MDILLNINKRRSAMSDLYKNIANEMPNKQNKIIIIPSAYEYNEFSDDFKLKIKEDFTDKNKLWSIFYAIRFSLKLRRLIKKHKCNNCYIHSDSDWFNIIFYFCNLNMSLNYLVWVHDPKLHEGENKIMHLIRRINSWTLFKNAHNIIVSYEEGKELLSTIYNINKNKINVCTLPQMTEMEFPSLIYSETKYDFIFFGRIEVYKGLDLLLESIKILSNKYHTNPKVLIIGTGRDEENVKCNIKQLHNVEFINEYVSNEDLAKYISQSKIVVLPYKSATGTQTIQIANYYNKPVIASYVGCFKEYVVNHVNGMHIKSVTAQELASIMNELYTNTDKYYEIVSNIELFFKEKFAMSNCVSQIETLLRGEGNDK